MMHRVIVSNEIGLWKFEILVNGYFKVSKELFNAHMFILYILHYICIATVVCSIAFTLCIIFYFTIAN